MIASDAAPLYVEWRVGVGLEQTAQVLDRMHRLQSAIV